MRKRFDPTKLDLATLPTLGFEHNDGDIDSECAWRHWGRYGFARRRNARHVVIKVRWTPGKEGDGPEWEVISRDETYGPPAR